MESEKQSYQSKKQLREQRKNEERNSGQKTDLSRKFKKYFIVLVIILGLGYGAYTLIKTTAPKGEDFSQSIPLLEALHIAEDSPLPEYTSNPPTSGPHFAQTARSGFRDNAISDQNVIHNLEHGDVWISYNPRITDSIIKELKPFGATKVIVTPREANDTDIALASWGRLDKFDIENNTLPVERIKDFIKRYTGKGPEQVPGASGGI